MKKKILFISGFLLSCLIVSSGIFVFQLSQNTKVVANKGVETTKEGLPIVRTTNLVTIETDTLNQLMETADLGINGVISKTENYVYPSPNGGDIPYTKLTVIIDHVYKGDQNLLNTEITILEFGGVVSKKDFGMDEKFPNMSEKELNEEVVILSEGLENSRKGQEIAAFLMSSANLDMETGFDYYQFTADYLSKFYLNQATGTYERLVPEEEVNTKIDEKEEIINEQITEVVEEKLTEQEVEQLIISN